MLNKTKSKNKSLDYLSIYRALLASLKGSISHSDSDCIQTAVIEERYP